MSWALWSLLVLAAAAGSNSCARTPSHGDGFLYLGDSGYAYLEDADVTDLDYSQSLSVEVIARIEPHQEGGRWATFIEKGGDFVLNQASSPGFGIGTYEGNSGDFAKSIMAKIGDGVNQLTIESPQAYQGYVHVVMSWDVALRTLTLFVNGQLIATRSAPALSPARIENNSDLRIGKGNYELRRNIFLARLWNRTLSASEVSQIWAAFAESKRHALPTTFNRSGLLSEWLMDRLYSMRRIPGTVQLSDNVGHNHLKLAGKARLILGDGSLAAAYPPDGAVGVGKSVVLQASGGRSELGESCTRPLHYCFEIDESPTFGSPALKRSGWVAHYGEWEPVLKPETQYYWRVKVRDSGTPAVESAFSPVRRLRTRGASTWYVRPLVDQDDTKDDLGNPLPDAAVYGRQDGTSYENAFNGIAHVTWGEEGVEAGDTLYICDTHVYHLHHGYWAPPVVGYIRESGFSSEHPITIAMDYPGAPGRLCGFFRDLRVDINWVGPDEHGVYRTSDLVQGAAVEATGDDYIWLERVEDIMWEERFGVVRNLPREQEPWFVETAYVKMSDGGSPQGRVYSPDSGFRLDLGRSSFIEFRNCSFFNSVVLTDANEDTVSERPPSHDIVFENCDIGYKSDTLIELGEGMDNWIVRGCTLHHGGKGIHAVTAHNLLVEHCEIHDIGAPGFPHDDAHAIGVQNGANHVFQDNHIWNTAGSAVEFWSSRYTMRDMTVRYNFIHDTLGLAKTSASGIVISGGERVVPGSRTGFRIHHNIIMNTAGGAEFYRGFGISSNSMDPVEIYNNVLYRTHHGIRLVTSTPAPGYPVKAKVYNNMIVEPNDVYAFVDGNSQPWDELFWDYNLYYPAADSMAGFSFGQEVARDGHSVFGDPRLVAANRASPEDFRLQPDSPAIDAGAEVGLTQDYAGGLIPRGAAPDVGAFEYP